MRSVSRTLKKGSNTSSCGTMPSALACGGVVGHHVVAHHGDAAAAGARQAGQHRDQRGLAGAVGAQQAEELAGLDVEETRRPAPQGAPGAV
jgi:hypothetical protein